MKSILSNNHQINQSTSGGGKWQSNNYKVNPNQIKEVEKTKRLYYKNPVKALYMMKEFGVNLIDYKVGYEIDLYDILDALRGYRKGKIYVDKESELIFIPREGDEGRIKTRVGASYLRYNLKTWIGHGITPEIEPEIIMRDNKQFFSCEVEND